MTGERRGEWIDSLGGPLIMLPAASLPHWRGSFGASEVGVGATPLGTDEEATDYAWACAVNDLIAVQSAYGDAAVILNDQPLGTTWRQISSGEGVIARVDTTDQPRSVLSEIVAGLTDLDRRALLTPDETIDQIAYDAESAKALKVWARGGSARLNVSLRGGGYRIFDSVDEGIDLRESLAFRLDAGVYEILSGWHRVDAQTAFVLHWLRWLRPT